MDRTIPLCSRRKV